MALGLTADSQLADRRRTLAATQDQAGDIREYLAPSVLSAVAEVQAQAVQTACNQARTAIRDGVEVPAAVEIVNAQVAAAPTSYPVLDGIDNRWHRMLQPRLVQTEMEMCAADERSRIGAERQAAANEAASALDTCEGFLNAVENAGRPPTSGEVQYLYIECGIDIAG